MVFIHRSESPRVCVCVFFQGEHAVLFAIPEEAPVLWEGNAFHECAQTRELSRVTVNLWESCAVCPSQIKLKLLLPF